MGVAILIVMISCGKDNPAPPPTPPVVNPTINNFSLSKNTIYFNGQAGLGKIDISWSTSNGSAYLNDSAVSASGVLKVNISQNKSYTLKLVSEKGANVVQTKSVTVSVDPNLEKITGLTGRKWKPTSIMIKPPGSSVFQEYIFECEKIKVRTYFPNTTAQIDYGTNPNCGVTGVENSNEGVFTFNPSTMYIFDNMTSSMNTQKVSFPTPDTMLFEDSRPAGDVYRRYYVRN